MQAYVANDLSSQKSCHTKNIKNKTKLNVLNKTRMSKTAYKPKEFKSFVHQTDIYLLQGTFYCESMLYDAAIHSLNKAIEHNANNHEAYIERAYAYFEIGEFDKALADFQEFEKLIASKPPFLSKQDHAIQLHAKTFLREPKLASEKTEYQVRNDADFFTGLVVGGRLGMDDSAKEFIPSTAGSITGIGQALWALAKNPCKATKGFVETCVGCIQLMYSSPPGEFIEVIVPELKELKDQWLALSDFERGQRAGHLIGKYGIDIFSGQLVGKSLKSWRILRRANARYTLTLCVESQENKKVIIAAAKAKLIDRAALKKIANLKIHDGKQGKHIKGHNNYQKHLNKSILEIDQEAAQKLVDEFAFTGRKDYKSSASVGMAGYREVVNFKETIGLVVNEKTGQMIETTYGKIHYANDGTHIVPCLPRE